jgi:hypothetical protein
MKRNAISNKKFSMASFNRPSTPRGSQFNRSYDGIDASNLLQDDTIDPFSVWMRPSSLSPYSSRVSPSKDMTDSDQIQELTNELAQTKEDLYLAAEIGQSILAEYRRQKKDHVDLVIGTPDPAILSTSRGFSGSGTPGFWRRKYENLERSYSLMEEENERLRRNMSQLSKREISSNSPQRSHTSDMRDFDVFENYESQIESYKTANRNLEKRLAEESRKVRDMQDGIEKYHELLQENNQISVERDRLFEKNRKLEDLVKDAYNSDTDSKEEELIMLVKELSSVNERLQIEKEELKHLLDDARHELGNLNNSSHENEVFITSATPDPRSTIFGELETVLKESLDSSNHLDKSQQTSGFTSNNDSFQASPLSPLQKSKSGSMKSSNLEHAFDTRSLLYQKQFYLLSELISSTRERYQCTNVLNLNKRLKKNFDLPSLTNLSNSIIDHISFDISGYLLQFSNLSTNLKEDLSSHNPEEIVNSLVKSIIDCLIDIGSLRKSSNDLGLALYDKINALSKADIDQRDSSRQLNSLKAQREMDAIRRKNNFGKLKRSVSQSFRDKFNKGLRQRNDRLVHAQSYSHTQSHYNRVDSTATFASETSEYYTPLNSANPSTIFASPSAANDTRMQSSLGSSHSSFTGENSPGNKPKSKLRRSLRPDSPINRRQGVLKENCDIM